MEQCIIKRCFLLFFLVFTSVYSIFSQEIVTAEQYLKTVSDRYAEIRDYEARIIIRSGNSGEMFGTVSHLAPSLFRIDFSTPAEQVIVFNGETLTVYLPDYRSTLTQTISARRPSASTGAGIASSQGLSLLRRNYIPAFVASPEPVPLDSGSEELVVKLRLARRSVSEGFREIILDINPETLLIRRIEGRTIADSIVRFDFSNMKINQGIPEQRFVYDSPANSNMYNNFLFRDTE